MSKFHHSLRSTPEYRRKTALKIVAAACMAHFLILCHIISYPSTAATAAPQPLEITLHGSVGDAEKRANERLLRAPFDNAAWLRADLTREMKRFFTNFSGDISGRFLEVAALLAPDNANTGKPGGNTAHPHFPALARQLPALQNADGSFCDPKIRWDGQLSAGGLNSPHMPALWGHSRLLCGLVETHRATGNADIRRAAARLGDFYARLTPRLTDPDAVAAFTRADAGLIRRVLAGDAPRGAAAEKLDTYAAGYGTCFFPAVEGLVKLNAITGDARHLDAARRIAVFYAPFDLLRTAHTHGMLSTYYGMLLLAERDDDTNAAALLAQCVRRWEELTAGGHIAPTGGVAEGNNMRPNHIRDEGCSETDWLRFNLKLAELDPVPARRARYLDMADRLVHNHFLSNQWRTGGFGHRRLFADKQGVFGYGTGDTEAVWCCNFHGALGFLHYKNALANWSSKTRTLTVNFAENFEAKGAADDNGKTTDKTPRMTSTVAIGGDSAEQRLVFPDGFRGKLDIRKPDWAKTVKIQCVGASSDSAAKDGDIESVDSRLRTKSEINLPANGAVIITYKDIRGIEDRRFRPLDLAAIPKGEKRHAVFRHGPWISTRNGAKTIPKLTLKNGQSEPADLPRLATIGAGSEKDIGVFVFEIENTSGTPPPNNNTAPAAP
jgi:hypothetical protein